MQIDIVGAPLDLGAALRGVDVGPSAIRHSHLIERLRLLGHEVNDLGNVAAPIQGAIDVGSDRARFADAVAQVCQSLRAVVHESLMRGGTPLVLGGDHSISAGTLAGVFDGAPDVRVLWFDAHGDLNTPETTPSGNVHGMPLAVALGQAPTLLRGLDWDRRHLSPDQVVLIGVRSLDPGERALIHRLGLRVFTIADVDRWGIYNVVEQALHYLNPGAGKLHVSLDLDVVDPSAAPGVGTPVSGGMTIRETHLALEMIAQRKLLGSMDVVEVNALRDHENMTGRLAADFILSAFGQTIL